MDYEVKHIKEECRFEIFQNKRLASVKYQLLDSELMNIYHMEIVSSEEEQRLESLLIKEVLEYARKNHYRVLTTCSLVRNYLGKHPNCQNMLL